MLRAIDHKALKIYIVGYCAVRLCCIDEHSSKDVKHFLEKQPLLKPEFHSKARQFQVSTCYHYRRATEWNTATMHMIWFENDSEMFRNFNISATKKTDKYF